MRNLSIFCYNISDMFSSLKEQWLFYLTILFIAGIFVFLGLVTFPKYQRGTELKKRAAELDEVIEKKKREIAELKDFQQRFRSDPDFVEKIARQNHRVYPGELVFVFVDE